MIYIATVHWETDKWIDIQLKYLNRYIKQPFRIYAFLSGSAATHRDKFFFASTEPIQSHAVKLNILGEIICHEAESDDDILVFIDGDAFPIADTETAFAVWLKDSPLAAVQRLENVGDVQPHPSFCITTVGFWRKINGDWKEGSTWPSVHGAITDVGGNLMMILRDNKIDWLPILRTSGTPVHPLWFGVYGDVVYHHGAGFRLPISRADKENAMLILRYGIWYNKIVYWFLASLVPSYRYFFLKYNRNYNCLIRSSSFISEKIYQNILTGRNIFEILESYCK